MCSARCCCRREGPFKAAPSAEVGLEGQEDPGSGTCFGGICTGFGGRVVSLLVLAWTEAVPWAVSSSEVGQEAGWREGSHAGAHQFPTGETDWIQVGATGH